MLTCSTLNMILYCLKHGYICPWNLLLIGSYCTLLHYSWDISLPTILSTACMFTHTWCVSKVVVEVNFFFFNVDRRHRTADHQRNVSSGIKAGRERLQFPWGWIVSHFFNLDFCLDITCDVISTESFFVLFCVLRLIGGSDNKLIYRHYATLYFVFCVDSSESELGILDLIQVRFSDSSMHFD